MTRRRCNNCQAEMKEDKARRLVLPRMAFTLHDPAPGPASGRRVSVSVVAVDDLVDRVVLGSMVTVVGTLRLKALHEARAAASIQDGRAKATISLFANNLFRVGGSRRGAKLARPVRTTTSRHSMMLDRYATAVAANILPPNTAHALRLGLVLSATAAVTNIVPLEVRWQFAFTFAVVDLFGCFKFTGLPTLLRQASDDHRVHVLVVTDPAEPPWLIPLLHTALASLERAAVWRKRTIVPASGRDRASRHASWLSFASGGVCLCPWLAHLTKRDRAQVISAINGGRSHQTLGDRHQVPTEALTTIWAVYHDKHAIEKATRPAGDSLVALANSFDLVFDLRSSASASAARLTKADEDELVDMTLEAASGKCSKGGGVKECVGSE